MNAKLSAIDLLASSEIRFTDTARILTVNIPFLIAVGTMREVLQRHGVQPVITSGCDFDPHRVQPYHAKGYAWDWRSRDLSDANEVFKEIQTAFAALDKRWHCLYHDQGTGLHFHVQFNYDQ